MADEPLPSSGVYAGRHELFEEGTRPDRAGASRALSTLRADAFCIGALLLATLAFALVVVRDFSGPLVNVDDTNALEHLGYMMEEHLTLGVLPRLQLESTRAMLYPFGTLVVFLPWGVERDLVYTLLHGRFGEGPWLQLYQVASVAISSLGTYFLLRREEGASRAVLVAFVGTFMNFYAVYKFPHHMNVTPLHWALLSIVVDFVLFRRLVRRQRWSARLVLARIVLLPLLLGLDIGYVVGYALLSFAVTSIAAIVLVIRARRRGENLVAAVLPRAPLRELREHPATTILFASLLVVALWLYLPIVAQIFLATRKFTFSGPGGSFWASQFRLLFPYLPFIGPQSKAMVAIFGDAEGIGEFSTGWALLALAIVGLRGAKRRRELVVYAPILAAFVLCFLYHPRALPTLRLFPWFQFNRVAGRATLFFPIWFALVALGAHVDFAVARVRAWATAIGLFAAVETVTAYAAFRYDVFRPDASFWAYMTAVREEPGEAVLDWPFCISGGNGVATQDLCPYYALTSTTYAYRRFHKKDVVGLLLSRMTEAQAKPFYDLGFAKLFAPDNPEIRTARRQTRCFDEQDWQTFETFYRSHDFAGVSLYPDLLPEGCAEQFTSRFGAPSAETRLPAEGRALFIPRRQPR
ncbi:hypothetical protein AKJ09_10161 [Labilithrix luteola]|uniref:Glycosyltransferase RgtA/B/C/D-like domain-containing protein n=2 Tax=Labilithrix luteola TaxID=1391654 RepID=A0A0K1QCP5_9BACT|nr:hypothetical protein AKJ09_10161 [Labilithrix luteola]